MKLFNKLFLPFSMGICGIVIFAVIVIFTGAPWYAGLQSKGMQLSGVWESCYLPPAVLSEKGLESCNWRKFSFGSSFFSSHFLFNLEKLSGNTVIYRKEFRSPDFCEQKGCFFTIGNLWISARIFLNGKLVGYHGTPLSDNKFAALQPVRVFLPYDFLKKGDGLNHIEMVFDRDLQSAILNKKILFPITIMSTEDSLRVFELGTAGIVILPLLSSFTLFCFGFLTLLIYRVFRTNQDLVRWFVLYCIFGGFFLISLSRVPREYIPTYIIQPIHAFLRILSDVLLFYLVLEFIPSKQKVKKWIWVGYFGLFAFLVVELIYNLSTKTLWFRVVGQYFSFDPHALCLALDVIFDFFFVFALFRLKEQEGNERKILLWTVGGLFVFQVYDLFAYTSILPEIYFSRFYRLLIGFSFGYLILRRIILAQRDIGNQALYVSLAKQVAHDIRSPLAALSTFEKDAGQLPEEHRVLMRMSIGRIQDIANTLLSNTRHKHKFLNGALSQVFSMETVVAEIVSEKRLEHREKLGIEIIHDRSIPTYGLFALLNKAEFGRALSNIINNAVEALKGKGEVRIKISQDSESAHVHVLDNGTGIPADILPKLTKEEITHKAGGSGLGLLHASNTLKDLGGGLEIRSGANRGTEVIIKIPKVDPPKWFVSSLALYKDMVLVIVDDEPSIHEIWQNRIYEFSINHFAVESVHLSSSFQLKKWLGENPSKVSTGLFLVDYEMGKDGSNGLELISSLKITSKSILVTSHSEDNIFAECIKLGVDLIPKFEVSIVPLSVKS